MCVLSFITDLMLAQEDTLRRKPTLFDLYWRLWAFMHFHTSHSVSQSSSCGRNSSSALWLIRFDNVPPPPPPFRRYREENAVARARKQTSRLARAAKKGWESALKRSGSNTSAGSSSRARTLSNCSNNSAESLTVPLPLPTRPSGPRKRHTFHRDLRLSLNNLEGGAMGPHSPSNFSTLPLSSHSSHSQTQFDFPLHYHSNMSQNQSAPTTPSYVYAPGPGQAWSGPGLLDEAGSLLQFRPPPFPIPHYYSAATTSMTPLALSGISPAPVWPATSAPEEGERQSWIPREEGPVSPSINEQQWDLPTPPAETTSPSVQHHIPTEWSRPVSRLTRPPLLHSHSLPASLASFPVTLLPSPQPEEQPSINLESSSSYYASTASEYTGFSHEYLNPVTDDHQMPTYEDFHRGQMEGRSFEYGDLTPMSSRMSPQYSGHNDHRSLHNPLNHDPPAGFSYDTGYPVT